MEGIPARTRAQHPCSASVVGARKHSEETWRTRPIKVSSTTLLRIPRVSEIELALQSQLDELVAAKSEPLSKVIADIHPMTGLLRPKFARMEVIGKTGPWPCGLPCTKAGDVGTLGAGNVDFDFIKTQFSLGFRWNS